MKVTIIGPNLMDQSLGQFHVHAAGCRDINRGRSAVRFGYPDAAPHMDTDAETRLEVAEFVYSDHMAEAEPGSKWTRPEPYLPDFHFAPCAGGLS